jgi:hypothetical protein
VKLLGTYDTLLLSSTQVSPIRANQRIHTIFEPCNVRAKATHGNHTREPRRVEYLAPHDDILNSVVGKPGGLLAVRCTREASGDRRYRLEGLRSACDDIEEG